MSERVVVMVRPRGVGPSWWPRLGTDRVDILVSPRHELWYPPLGRVVEYGWNTVTDTGGFTAGFDPTSAVEGDVELAERVEAWFEAHEDDPWPWELRAVILDD